MHLLFVYLPIFLAFTCAHFYYFICIFKSQCSRTTNSQLSLSITKEVKQMESKTNLSILKVKSFGQEFNWRNFKIQSVLFGSELLRFLDKAKKIDKKLDFLNIFQFKLRSKPEEY